ncbi:MAG: hypothetical protein STSR0003_26120 [Smithella sp.]
MDDREKYRRREIYNKHVPSNHITASASFQTKRNINFACFRKETAPAIFENPFQRVGGSTGDPSEDRDRSIFAVTFVALLPGMHFQPAWELNKQNDIS